MLTRERKRPGRWGARAWQDDTVFLIAASLLLIVAMAATRYYVCRQTLYHAVTTTNLISLVTTPNLPHRSEKNHTVLAAAQQILNVSSAPTCESPTPEMRKFCADLASFHEAIESLAGTLAAASPRAMAPLDDYVFTKLAGLGPSEAQNRLLLASQITEALSRARGAGAGNDSAIVPCELRLGPSNSSEATAAFEKLETSTPHERLFGNAGCDPPLANLTERTVALGAESSHRGPAVVTKLLIPSRENACASNRQADNGDFSSCFSQRVRDANDLSQILDPLLTAAQSLNTSEPLDPGKPRIVQVYFVSPDSVLRYADLQARDPRDSFRAATLWNASPFIQLPIAKQADQRALLEHDGRPSFSPISSAREICAAIPPIPYLDLGGYGLVRTRCTCVLRGDAELLGSFCTDYTVPIKSLSDQLSASEPDDRASTSVDTTPESGAARLSSSPTITGNHGLSWTDIRDYWFSPDWATRPTNPPNELFDWRAVRIRRTVLHSGSCTDGIEVLALHRAGEMQSHARLPVEDGSEVAQANQLRAEICGRLSGLGEEFFETVQPFTAAQQADGAHFLVPVGRVGTLPEPDFVSIVLWPRQPQQPIRTLAFMVGAWCFFGALLVLRKNFERNAAVRAREESILRNLQVGVVDVSGSDHTVVEFGNDRAEELLGRNLPVFGSTVDSANRVDLRSAVLLPMLLEIDEECDQSDTPGLDTGPRLEAKCWEDVERQRHMGVKSTYYVRLQYLLRAGKATKTCRLQWIRVKGSPWLDEAGRGARPGRTFAVLHSVSARRATELTIKHDKTPSATSKRQA